MNNSAAIIRALITYAICIPLAVILGVWAVSLANAPSYSNFAIFGVLVLILSAPILLRWHHPLMILCWNLPVAVFFLKGSPGIVLPMMALSLAISVMQRTMNKNMRFVPATPIVLPLVYLMLVVLATAKLTGGIGLHALGSSVMGGKKYVYLLAGILGFFAITARRIPPQQAWLYMSFYLLAPCASVIGDMVAFVPSAFYFIFWIFPADFYAYTASGSSLRFAGVGAMAAAIFKYMLARYEIKGIFRAGQPWRLVLFFIFSALTFWGGFRGVLLEMAVLFFILFLLEGLHRTRLLPMLLFAGLLGAVICFPIADRLPYTFQRVLSILPVKIDPGVRSDAEASYNWRIEMWRALLPQVPRYLVLGKGYAITAEDALLMGSDTAFQSIDPSQQGLAISGDYHSGPLSVIIPFGIMGAIAFLWFLIAGVWALNRNRLYGDPALRTINDFLFALLLTKIIMFFIVFGALSNDMLVFASIIGLSVSFNGGICRPAQNPASKTSELPARLPAQPRWQPAFHR